jgi:uncharacterized protein (DUF1501 family)
MRRFESVRRSGLFSRIPARHIGCSLPSHTEQQDVMNQQHAMEVSVNQGFDRLQRILTTMTVGEDISPARAAEATGLSEEVCRAMFAGLERAGLMTQGPGDRFIRCPLDLMKS